jgi:predicted O-methyltransferase YrrM
MAEPEVRVFDKLLPNLRTNNEYFAGSDEEYVPALYETIARASGLLEPGEELVFESSERFTQAAMGSNPVSTRFLQILARLVRAERVLEVGTFVGVSAIYLARALEAGGRVVTIEKFPEFAAIAQRNFVANGVQDRITLLVGDAIERIEELPADEPFDLVFLDGHKERYAEYFEAIAPRLRTGGLLVVDDVLFHGDALNRVCRTEKGEGVRRFLDRAAAAKDFLRLTLPLANGIMLMLKQ